MNVLLILSLLTILGIVMVIISAADHLLYQAKRIEQKNDAPAWIESLPYYSLLCLSGVFFFFTSADHVITLWVAMFGLVVLIDKIYWAPRRLSLLPQLAHMSYKAASQHEQYGKDYLRITSPWVKLAHEFFTSTLVLWLVISFLVHPYRVPSGSLQPTIDPGDMLIAKKWSYGIRMPLTNEPIWTWNGTPKRGDIAIFTDPTDPYRTLVKRIVGLPGDHISYQDKQLFINNKPVETSSLGVEYNFDHNGEIETVLRKIENLPNKEHEIFIKPDTKDWQSVDLTIPDNHYFMMGDNRDASADSRYFGPVPFETIGGQAWLIWMSINPYTWEVRWDRIGKNLT